MTNEADIDYIVNELFRIDGIKVSLENLALIHQLESRRPEFRDAFIDELARVEEETIQAVRESVFGSLMGTLTEHFKSLELKTRPYNEVKAQTYDNGDGLVNMVAHIEIYTGWRSEQGQVVSDHKEFMSLFRNVKTIGIDGFDNNDQLQFKISEKASSAVLKQPIISQRGLPLPYTHLVQVSYAAQIPKDMYPAIYRQQMLKK